MLFLGGLAETGGSVFIGLSFAHSSLIVRSSFAQGSNRKIFCLGYVGFLLILRCDILGCASSLTMLKARTEKISVGG